MDCVQLLKNLSWSRFCKLTESDTLFRTLASLQGNAECLETLWNHVKDETIYGTDFDEKRKWADVRTMIWCAQQADALKEHELREFIQNETLELSHDKKKWAWNCIQVFRYSDSKRSLKIPVALWTKEEAVIAHLELTLYPSAKGVTHHPAHVFSTHSGKDFNRAMQTAWTAASRLAGEVSGGCWQLLQDDGLPVEDIDGVSAGGAAALGWYHLLSNIIPDPELIVLAEIQENGTLTEVDQVKKKIQAICMDGRFDKIVVVSERNFKEASQAVITVQGQDVALWNPSTNEAWTEEYLTPAQAPTLKQLVKVRSRIVDDLLEYLYNLTDTNVGLPRYFPRRLNATASFDVLRQRVAIIEDRLPFEQWVAEKYKRLNVIGQELEPLGYDPARAMTEDDELVSESAQPVDVPQPIEWDETARSRFHRAVILGDPGFGKSWLLRHEALRLAHESAEQVQAQTTSKDELTFPIFADFKQIEHKMEIEKGKTFADLLAKHVSSDQTSDSFRKFIKNKLTSKRCVILLDAWDEVRDQQKVKILLLDFARIYSKPQIFITSRIATYDNSPIPDAKELELLAFDQIQIRTFVRIWFGSDIPKARKFLSALSNKSQIYGLGRIPLMLTLMCRLFQENESKLPTRRVDIFNETLYGLLYNWPREDKDQKKSRSKVEAMLESLEVVAYKLFPKHQFSEIDVREAMLPWLSHLKNGHELYGSNSANLIDEWKRDGIFVTVGEDDRDAPLPFLHRTFHEYLTARSLAREVENGDWQAIAALVDRKAWLTQWEPVLILLAGELEDPAPLLRLLANEKRDDLFCHRLALAAQCMNELSEKFSARNSCIINQISTAVLFHWIKFHAQFELKPLYGRLKAGIKLLRHLEQAMQAVGAVDGRIDNSLCKRKIPGRSGYSRLWKSLRLLKKGQSPSIIELLIDYSYTWEPDAPTKIAVIGDEKSGFASITGHSSSFFGAEWREAAVRMLGVMGREAAAVQDVLMAASTT